MLNIYFRNVPPSSELVADKERYMNFLVFNYKIDLIVIYFVQTHTKFMRFHVIIQLEV